MVIMGLLQVGRKFVQVGLQGIVQYNFEAYVTHFPTNLDSKLLYSILFMLLTRLSNFFLGFLFVMPYLLISYNYIDLIFPFSEFSCGNSGELWCL